MTGRYPPRCGLTGNPVPKDDLGGGKKADELGLPVTEVTLADLFRKAGYATACVGKWHLGHQPQFRPLKRGFDDYLGVLYSNDMHPVELIDGDQMVRVPDRPDHADTPADIASASSSWRTNKDKPFLLYLAAPDAAQAAGRRGGVSR